MRLRCDVERATIDSSFLRYRRWDVICKAELNPQHFIIDIDICINRLKLRMNITFSDFFSVHLKDSYMWPKFKLWFLLNRLDPPRITSYLRFAPPCARVTCCAWRARSMGGKLSGRSITGIFSVSQICLSHVCLKEKENSTFPVFKEFDVISGIHYFPIWIDLPRGQNAPHTPNHIW